MKNSQLSDEAKLNLCLAHKTVFKQQKVGEGKLWSVFFILQG